MRSWLRSLVTVIAWIRWIRLRGMWQAAPFQFVETVDFQTKSQELMRVTFYGGLLTQLLPGFFGHIVHDRPGVVCAELSLRNV